jgi:hypothetical protein
MISEEFDILERKILNIKIYEEDFDLIKIAILNSIQNINKNINNLDLDNEIKEKLQNDIIKYKRLLSKLDICKLYNENI